MSSTHGASEQPGPHQHADDQAVQPDQRSHLVLREAELSLDPEEDLLVSEDESPDWFPRSKAIPKPVHQPSMAAKRCIAMVRINQQLEGALTAKA